MSIDCFSATNSNAVDVVCFEAQESPCRLSTTSLEVFDNEKSGNNGVLDLDSTNSRASNRKIPFYNKQESESNDAVLKSQHLIDLPSEDIGTSLQGEANTRNDRKIEPENVASPSSATGTQKVRKNESQERCRFYQRNQFCKFGQSCRFLHEGATHNNRSLASSTFDEKYANAFDVEEYENLSVHRRSYHTRPVCRYFQYYGYCDYGDRCYYEHIFIPQGGRSKQYRQTPVKTSKKNLKEKENQSTYSANVTAATGYTNDSDHQNALESHVSDGDNDSPSPMGGIKSEKEQSELKKTTGRSTDKPQLQKRKSETEKPNVKRTVCRFFKQYGNCKYEERCTYLHVLRSFIPDDDRQAVHEDSQKMVVSFQSSIDSSSPLDDVKSKTEKQKPKKSNQARKQKAKKADCIFFKQYGNCKYGDRCRYLHEAKVGNSTEIDHKEIAEEIKIKGVSISDSTASADGQGSTNIREENDDEQSEAYKQSPKTEVQLFEALSKPSLLKPLGAIQIHLLDQLSEEDLKALRQTEITQLKKRFPRCEVLQEESSDSEYVVDFLPSDPDWPFEVKLLHLKVLFSSEYPLKPCFIEVVDVEDHFPETLVRYLDKSMQSWIQKRHDETAAANKVEIIFKPFLRWLDRNLEDLFISGLRMVKKEREAEAAGIEFVPYEKLKSTTNQDSSEEVVQLSEVEAFNNEIIMGQNSATPPTTGAKATTEEFSPSSLKRGTEVVLRNMALGENAATLACRKIALTLQCGRCKSRNEIESPANRSNRIFCTKCHHVQTLTYRPQLLHQFGCVLGYLDLAGCQVVDMPIANCNFEVTCLQCSTNMPLNGLHYGQRNDNWCHNCNSKMTIFVESVKFHQLQPSTNQVGKGHLIKLEPKEKRVKDPAIQEGKPLPSDGTCKHFKKSYRWLRFPCCGKAYPCDVCHDEKETDHDMKYATRMICGFCAKEQPYSTEKPCVLCKSNMTKKSSTHWEGGKGCRDKTKMSRDDQHKYSGTSKTISRKVQEKTKPAAAKK